MSDARWRFQWRCATTHRTQVHAVQLHRALSCSAAGRVGLLPMLLPPMLLMLLLLLVCVWCVWGGLRPARRL